MSSSRNIQRFRQRFRALPVLAITFLPASVGYPSEGGPGPVAPAATGHPVTAVVLIALAAVLVVALAGAVLLTRRRRAATAGVDPYPSSDQATTADRDTTG